MTEEGFSKAILNENEMKTYFSLMKMMSWVVLLLSLPALGLGRFVFEIFELLFDFSEWMVNNGPRFLWSSGALHLAALHRGGSGPGLPLRIFSANFPASVIFSANENCRSPPWPQD
jgi:hypothetical protein